MLAVASIHVVVEGLVQGVSFRWHTRRTAQELNLQGWVRNRRDGSVEVMAAGEAKHVDQLVEWLHQGPPSARVDGVRILPDALPVEDGPFRIVH
jgi:acylphosphatase